MWYPIFYAYFFEISTSPVSAQVLDLPQLQLTITAPFLSYLANATSIFRIVLWLIDVNS